MIDKTHWQKPSWISSRSYAGGTPNAHSFLTNAQWWTNAVLTGLSADLWALLPPRFFLQDIAQDLSDLGISLVDENASNELADFLNTLWLDGFLHKEGVNNPQPNHHFDEAPKGIATELGAVTTILSVHCSRPRVCVSRPRTLS